MTESRSKHQHWVPQFYLRYFATKETRNSNQPQVWIFSKNASDGDEKLTNVRNVCGKRYLYAPVQTNGKRDWALDKCLDDLESLLSDVWPSLAEDYVPLDELNLRKGLALFVAVMHLRNPAVRADVERIHSNLVQFYEASPRLADGTPDIERLEINGQVRDFLSYGWKEYCAWGKDEHDRFFAHIVQSEATRIAEMLLSKRWSVVCSDQEMFITTDKPVGLQHQTREKFGFGTPGTIVSFPLSPTRLLTMDDMHAEPANQYYPIDSNGPSFNFITWRNGSRFLVTGRPIPEVLTEMLSLKESA